MKPAWHRSQRMADEIRRRLSEVIPREVRDPRLGFLTITQVTVSGNLRFAKVFVSVLGSEEEQKQTMRILEHARGFLRHDIGQTLRLRYVPDLEFELDHTAEQADRVHRLMQQISSGTAE